MPEIEIRPAIADDIQTMLSFEHDYVSDYVWQMDIQRPEDAQISISFRQMRLPRSVKVEYPRPFRSLERDWDQRPGLLVGVYRGDVVGYISLAWSTVPLAAWVTDLVVLRKMRRQGVASALILSAEEWARQHLSSRLILEIQPKNHPMINLAKKMGFDYCGYNDRYYPNQDIAIFFAKSLW